MAEIQNPDSRFAEAGNAHHDAVQKLLVAFRERGKALEEALAVKAKADADKDALSQYLEHMTAAISAEIEAQNGAEAPQPAAPVA